MKKLFLFLAMLLAFTTSAQSSISVQSAEVSKLTVDVVHVGQYLPITYQADTALGTNGTVEIYGNLTEGRIVVNTGSGSTGKTPCRIVFPEGYNLETDNATVILIPYDGKFFQVVAQAVEGNGFEIFSKELWEDNTSYEFRYFIISHVQ